MVGAVGLIATGVGAVLPGLAVAGIAVARVGAIAGFIAGVANIGAQLTAKHPPARGSETQIQIAVEPPQPYLMGEAYSAGVSRHRAAYGATLNKVPNPYYGEVVVYSGCGPLEALVAPQFDFGAIDGWYSGFAYTASQLGACPEGAALSPHFGGMPGWGASSKLSGQAAILWNFLFDKDGKRFADGIPPYGAVWQGVKVYDPRADSTYPGGSGSQRADDEATWEWSDNPALHALTYAIGRWQNGQKVFGIGVGGETPWGEVRGIVFASFVAWANVCEANGWRLSGSIYEPGDRWANLKDICAAGGARPVVAGGQLSVQYAAPHTALATVTAADLADDDIDVGFMQSFRDRLNAITPKYRSPDHNWEFVSAAEVSVPAYETEDGQKKAEERQWNLVRDAGQAAQLAAYALSDGRELGPIALTLGPAWRWVKPGDCLHYDIAEAELDHDVIVIARQIDPATLKVTLTAMSEDPAKHDFALGRTPAPPPTPALAQTAQERDELAAGAGDRQVAIEIQQSKNYPADYTATVPAGLLPDTIIPRVTLGGADIRTSDNVSYSIVTGGVTASVNDTDGDPDKGTITVSSIDALQGYIDMTVTVSGVDYPAKRIVMQKIVGLPASLGGSGSKIAGDNSFNAISGTSYAPITDVLTVTVASGESLYGTAPLDYYVDGVAYRYVTAKWQYSPIGAGTWTDFGGAIDGTTGGGGDDLPGYGDFTHSVSPSAGDYDVRLVAKVSGAGPTVIFTGTATIEAKV